MYQLAIKILIAVSKFSLVNKSVLTILRTIRFHLQAHCYSRNLRMFSAISQATTTTQFYLYGKKHCTKTGWENAIKSYPQPDILQDSSLDLSDKVYMITGANAGIGREITTFLASRSATVYMVCRTALRAEAARAEISEKTNNSKLYVLLGDCGVDADLRRIWSEFLQSRKSIMGATSDENVTLNGLVCNAGALDNTKKLTPEGVEVTIATHLIFGTYLLGTLALPTLARSADARLVVISSGGMYNTKFPSWNVATSTVADVTYDGQLVYAYAKRGQVLLCEEWATQYGSEVKVVSCHPGWTQTEALDAAYGEKKKYLEPLRNTWEGAEGIVWLLVAPGHLIQGGGFYLDRSPQMKHLPGLLYGESTFTKNTRVEIDAFMAHLCQLTSLTDRPSIESRLKVHADIVRARPLGPLQIPVDIPSFMGRWYVLASIPTYFEIDIHNGIENYSWDESRQRIDVDFEYWGNQATSVSHLGMRGQIMNAPLNTHWNMELKLAGVFLPINSTYLIIDIADDRSWVTVGVPDRSYLWIMTRDIPSHFTELGVQALAAYDVTPTISEAAAAAIGGVNTTATQLDATGVAAVSGSERDEVTLKECAVLTVALGRAEVLGYDVSKVLRVPWHDRNL